MDEWIPDYDDLQLRLDRSGDGTYRVRASTSDGRAASCTFEKPLTDEELDDFVRRVGLVYRRSRSRVTRMDDIQTLGSKLFQSLLKDEVEAIYYSARAAAEEQGRGLRITLLLSDAPELMRLPWEFLYRRPKFLAQSSWTPVVRSLDLSTKRRPLKAGFPLRILGVVSSPGGLPELDTELERQRLESALSELKSQGLVELKWLERATLAELGRRFSAPDDIHVLHYIGHGAYDEATERGILALENSQGRVDDVAGEDLGAMLQDKQSLRLVVLNSCEGARTSRIDPFAGVATSLLEFDIPAVIGMQFEISDEAAIAFGESLYTALADGLPIDAALGPARRAIRAQREEEFGTPVLFLRATDARLFDLPPRGAQMPPSPTIESSGMQTATAAPSPSEEPSTTESSVAQPVIRLLRSPRARRPLVLIRGILAFALAVLVGLLVWPGLTTNLVDGKPVSVYADPFNVAGMRAAEGPSGLRDGAPGPTRKAAGSDDGEIDHLAEMSASDIEEFWLGAYSELGKGGEFAPVKTLISWDSDESGGQFCGSDVYRRVTSDFCPDDDAIGWDRGVFLPAMRSSFSDMAIPLVLAHEYGHSIQRQAKLHAPGTPVPVSEQQADCFIGAYMRWVAEGKSARFMLSSGDGLNNLLAAMIALRDPAGAAQGSMSEHGSGFERISVFQFGFTDGVSACVGIDEKEIAQRRGNVPIPTERDDTFDQPLDQQSVNSLIEALTDATLLLHPPKVAFYGEDCPDARETPPASYCPSTNTIAVDLLKLSSMSAPTESGIGIVSGTFAAITMLTSRFMLAFQHERGGLVLDNPEAALRTGCLTGVAMMRLRGTTAPDGRTFELTARGLDEALSGILINDPIVSNVNGETVPAGFARIEAFRIGLLLNQARCIERFP
jgi:predicted metalloprotease